MSMNNPEMVDSKAKKFTFIRTILGLTLIYRRLKLILTKFSFYVEHEWQCNAFCVAHKINATQKFLTATTFNFEECQAKVYKKPKRINHYVQ